MIPHILSEEDISLDLATKGMHSALSRIAVRIARRSRLDEQMVLRSLWHRECLGSTGIGRGVAIPHALFDTISSPVVSFTRLASPIDFDGPDDDPVDIVYTLLWPRSAVSAFLPALSQVCRVLRAPRTREGLRQAQSVGEVMAILDADPSPTIPPIRTLAWPGFMPRQLSNA
ncbi:PTS sugar transporter subunit IIA [Mesorhizobium sp. PAMC28654]|uniref:PTS sugar transporter subunit IIA n=1 Tax=Mesorhizobium sp. PAMC28654 TaxID=2880934 RepID=UPI001D0A32B2|nr:PTS sugar transporter subunit IIA [Mesorhizobium sp. PAMC28654]UDL90421.1 PTS sugar transporter subunit IIA [Mesorhizobium sp. PAMC28654]